LAELTKYNHCWSESRKTDDGKQVNCCVQRR